MSNQEILEFRINKVEKGMEDLKSEVKESMDDFKSDVREHLKEARENQRILTETMVIMRENMVRQTVLVEQMTSHLGSTNNRIDDVAEKVNDIREEVKADINLLKNEISTNSKEEVGWLRSFINNNFTIIVRVLVGLILTLLSIFAGVKIADIDPLGFFKF